MKRIFIIALIISMALIPYSLLGQGRDSKPYFVKLTEPDSGFIACETLKVKTEIHYNLFDIVENTHYQTDYVWTSYRPYGEYRCDPRYYRRPYYWNCGDEAPAYVRWEEVGIADTCPSTGEPYECDHRPRHHDGNDLEADSGTVILATYRSILEESIVMTGYGNCQSFYIPDLNITVMFAHLSEFNGDNRGTEYEPGDFLCMTGLSGNAVSTNQHVHVEVYTGRGRNTANRVDPEPYLFGKKDKHPKRKVIVAATRDDYNADTVVVENSLDTADVYTPNESEIIKFREPKPVTYEHTFDISGYPDGLMTASGAVCTTIVFAGEPHFVILDSDEQPGQKLCGNHTFIVQTGGYSTLEETYNYTDHWNSPALPPRQRQQLHRERQI